MEHESQIASPYIGICKNLESLIDDFYNEVALAEVDDSKFDPRNHHDPNLTISINSNKGNSNCMSIEATPFQFDIREAINLGVTNAESESDFMNTIGTRSCPSDFMNSCSVWVGNVQAPFITSSILKREFDRFGPIKQCNIINSRSCAFVNFFDPAHADAARKALNGAIIEGFCIKTGFSRTNKGDNGQYYYEEFKEASLDTIEKTDFGFYDLDNQIIFQTNIDSNEFKNTPPVVPPELLYIPEEELGSIKDCRKYIEMYSMPPEEIDAIASRWGPYIIAACLDSIGNILVQKFLERGTKGVSTDALLKYIDPYIATVGAHKNGTWAIQRLIKNSTTSRQREIVIKNLKGCFVALIQHSFGNYVIQCCVPWGPLHNQFIFEALYHRCLEIGTSRFGSRAMRSILESEYATRRQIEYVAMAIITHSVVLSMDINGNIVVKWVLDSKLPNTPRCIASVFMGASAISQVAASKTGCIIIEKILENKGDLEARKMLIRELIQEKTIQYLLRETHTFNCYKLILEDPNLRPEERIQYSFIVMKCIDEINSNSNDLGPVESEAKTKSKGSKSMNENYLDGENENNKILSEYYSIDDLRAQCMKIVESVSLDVENHTAISLATLNGSAAITLERIAGIKGAPRHFMNAASIGSKRKTSPVESGKTLFDLPPPNNAFNASRQQGTPF